MKKKLLRRAGFKPAFTMVELIFVIVVLGILAAVAIPRLAATRDDAVLVKGKSQVAAIRSGITMQKAKALLEGTNNNGTFTNFRLTRLDNIVGGFGQLNSELFYFGDGNTSNVLESPIFSKTDSSGGWMKTAADRYTFEVTSGTTIRFDYNNTTGIFGCGNDATCRLLTQ